ncbi:hypothetical protein N2600_00710 [Rhizobium sp. WSM1274]|uniref:hypothetical protein n=1 Tax=Rhizobium sp. WSM1274 TaxID=3138254 RepID=UPI0021A8D54D|nr:hypothetical protein [Rhizobium leguminosarum]UWU28535.1 hypothetical protein N2600_00710 [Rhizobium leguminosarum bv. viciae]
MKKDIPASAEPGYRSITEKSGRRESATEPGNIVETRKGTKTNRAGLGKGMRFRARRCIRRHNHAVTANTGGALHRFFGHARYFHHARNSGMMAASPPSPAGFPARKPPPRAWASLNGV